MSQLIVEVVEVHEVQIHPNADKLSLATVKGWQCIIGKDSFKKGDLVVFFPPDTLLPEKWTNKFGATTYCQRRDGEMMRVRQTRLRGEPSFGLVVACEDASWEKGKDVAEFYGAKKYEPPVVNTGGGFGGRGNRVLPDHPNFKHYVDIENFRNFPEVIKEGEEVVVTEKVHGTNSRIGMIDDMPMAGSHHRRLMPPMGKWENKICTFLTRVLPKRWLKGRLDPTYRRSTYWEPYLDNSTGVKSLLEALGKQHKQVILFGEIYGEVQVLKYGLGEKLEYRAFDLFVDGKYVDYNESEHILMEYKVNRVPVVYRGPFSVEKLKELSKGKTTINNADHVREGVVVHPIIERHDPKLGRVILKYINDDYLLGKYYEEDTTDV